MSNVVKEFIRNPSAMAGSLILILIIAIALAADILFDGDPLNMVAPPLLWPGEDNHFLLGSDSLGRDVAAGLAHGARVTLLVGFVAALISLVIGGLVGCVAGYFGGWVEDVLVRLTEVFQTIPSFLLVIVLVVIGSSTVPVIVMSIGLASWPVIARLVRAEFRAYRESEFVLAARSLGFSSTRIIFKEIFPNVMPPVIVTMSVVVASAILIETGLSFLGLGD